MSNKKTTISIGLPGGFGGALFITFLVLKLTGVIDWSWWWVTAPLWGPLAIVVGILAVVLTVAGLLVILAACIEWAHGGKRQ